jgi:hypothetical protein
LKNNHNATHIFVYNKQMRISSSAH